ncbi:glycosyltransferase [Pseudorhodoferax sp. Leaf265]|uniref:glycosyltransferase family 2 protein n=1 Tax=Pseudorhodoferax sp. Leaf265 TaxID=1736315 RepID=UPI0006F38E19|nr:glycosyltransferase [Pseudorhodoferax sp. Leaf265]KQP17264.1 glycosyl transferase [Pseudorhodoferax sp. Leaf265]
MPATPIRPITVSIVSHGQQALILPLLDQLDRHCARSIEKLVLTVNIPEQDFVDTTGYKFPIVRIVNPRPRGFGANHNAAFEDCSTEWFLVLNPDIRIDGDVLAAMQRLARGDDGVLTPRILEPGQHQPEPYRGLLTPCEIILRRRPGYTPPAQPAWIPGMFMLFRSKTFRGIGGFDLRFFMYGEDFDICARLQLDGWKVHAVETVRVRHAAQRASQRNLRHLQWHVTSLLRVWMSRAFWRYRAALLRDT